MDTIPLYRTAVRLPRTAVAVGMHTMRNWVGRLAPWYRRALDVVYPPRCVACGVFGRFLCERCEAKLEVAHGAAGRCANCCARWTDSLNCPRCVYWDALERGFAAVEMTGPARRLVHELKYRGVRELAPLMAAHMRALAEDISFDIALPIPLHRARTRSRGFNQAEALLNELGWPRGEGRLLRSRKTRTQVGLHLRERRSNVAGAFRYEGPDLDGRTAVLVDDVITTGATANECATVLRDHGAGRVYVVAFARASYEGDRPSD